MPKLTRGYTTVYIQLKSKYSNTNMLIYKNNKSNALNTDSTFLKHSENIFS